MAKRPEPTGPKPPLVGLVKVTLNYSGPGTPTPIAANILHIKWSDNTNHPLADLQTLANDVNSQYSSNTLNALMASTWVFDSTVVQSLGGDGLIASNTSTIIGTGTAPAVPPNCAMCISWLSGATWRGGRPRTYFPGLPTAGLSPAGSAQIQGSTAASAKSLFNGFRTGVSGLTIGGANPVLGFPSYFTKYQFRPTPLFFPFLGCNVHDRLDSQRRRSGKERYFPVS